jgi:hypothetical protein
MLRAQTRGNFRISEVFVTLDDEVDIYPQVQAQPERDLTYSEDIGGPSTAGTTDSPNI